MYISTEIWNYSEMNGKFLKLFRTFIRQSRMTKQSHTIFGILELTIFSNFYFRFCFCYENPGMSMVFSHYCTTFLKVKTESKVKFIQQNCEIKSNWSWTSAFKSNCNHFSLSHLNGVVWFKFCTCTYLFSALIFWQLCILDLWLFRKLLGGAN